MTLATTDSTGRSDELEIHALNAVVDDWIVRLQAAIDSAGSSEVADLFTSDAWWRDLLVLTWDFRTHHGHERIAAALEGSVGMIVGLQRSDRPITLQGTPESRFVEAVVTFTTPVGRGAGQDRDEAAKRVRDDDRLGRPCEKP